MPQPAVPEVTPAASAVYGIGSMVNGIATENPGGFFTDSFAEAAFTACWLYFQGGKGGDPPGASYVTAVQYLTETKKTTKVSTTSTASPLVRLDTNPSTTTDEDELSAVQTSSTIHSESVPTHNSEIPTESSEVRPKDRPVITFETGTTPARTLVSTDVVPASTSAPPELVVFSVSGENESITASIITKIPNPTSTLR